MLAAVEDVLLADGENGVVAVPRAGVGSLLAAGPRANMVATP